MEFVWKDGNYGIPAQTVGQIVSAIEERDGVCRSDQLLEEARPITSPIHGLFNWDDTDAAEKYRALQASQIIRSIRVIYQPGTESKIAFVHVRLLDQEGNGYVNSVRAMSEQKLREQVLAEALRQISALQERYRSLSELDVIWAAAAQVRQPRQRRRTAAKA